MSNTGNELATVEKDNTQLNIKANNALEIFAMIPSYVVINCFILKQTNSCFNKKEQHVLFMINYSNQLIKEMIEK